MYLQTVEDLRLVIKPDTSRLLTSICQFLAEEGIQSYLVGGIVRDMLLGRNTADIDIAVNANALDTAARVADALGGRYVPLDEENGVGRVITPDSKQEIDFTTLRGNIEQDLAQRDFTIDAMAIELNDDIDTVLSTDRIIDPYHGGDDVGQHIVRTVSETCFEADAARLIRAVRLAAELGFNIDSHTETIISQKSQLITDVAGERIREELLRILALPGAGRWLAYLDEVGILTALIPEMVAARGVDQPKVHAWDVFDHSIQTVNAVEYILREAGWDYASKEVITAIPWSDSIRQHFDQEVSSGSTRRSLIKLAALLHDIAKPQTKTVDDDGRARFLGHPQEGADTAGNILERLRFSSREIKLVEQLVRYHLRPTQMSHEELPTRRAIYRYFRDTGDAGIDILYLSLADHLATRGPYLDPAQWQTHAQIVRYVIDKHSKEESISAPPKLVNGRDIMNIFGLSPGPGVGQLLEALRETQAAGEVTTREEALDYVRRKLAKQHQKTRKEPANGEK
jgi:poly(A) polymerase